MVQVYATVHDSDYDIRVCPISKRVEKKGTNSWDWITFSPEA